MYNENVSFDSLYAIALNAATPTNTKETFGMFKNSPIPLWINIFMVILIFFMSIQVYWFYFDHGFLAEAGITINGVPDLNIVYTTAARLLAMVAITVMVVITQNPQQYLVVLLMSILREGQEMFIDPIYPYANSPASPAADVGMHIVIVSLEIAAFLTVLRRVRQSK